MQDKWNAAYILIVMLMTHGYAENLSVTVVPTQLRFSATEDVEVILNYTNNGPNSVSIHKRFLDTDELYDSLFELTLDGEPIDYVGPISKRRTPTSEDMITLNSGEHLSTNVQLSTVYDMSKAGTYTVQFKANIHSMLNTLTRNLGLDDSILQSTPATFYVEAHPNSLIAKSIEIQTTVRLMKSSTFSYLDCSSDQQSMIAAVIQPLLNYTDHTVQYLMSMNIAVTPRFTTWFGRYSLFNVITVRKRFANINAALSTQSIFFNCGCTASNDTYAYVYPKIPYIIFLCTQFWAADITGTNSKVGTIIHETSHFTIVAGTTDQMYGQEGCLQLATSNPVGATNNADTFEYFAENDPMLT